MNGTVFLFSRSLCCNSVKIFTFVAKVEIHFHLMRSEKINTAYEQGRHSSVAIVFRTIQHNREKNKPVDMKQFERP